MITNIAAIFAFTGLMGAQTIVVGTGKPEVDIPAVQAAVDRGGSVVLQGRFSFDSPPFMRGMLPGLTATVLVSKEVTISGGWDDRGAMTSIEGGETPFAIEAPGRQVRIERLHFIRPKRYAMVTDTAGGLAIESCIIEKVEPAKPSDDPAAKAYGFGIVVGSLVGLPSRDRPGQPRNISGKLSIIDNEISIGGTSEDYGMGIFMTSAGTPEQPVDVEISGNTIRNATQKGINIKQIGGRVRIERNTVKSAVAYTGHDYNPLRSGIHCGGEGSYLVAHNRIDIADPDAAGIRIRAFPGMDAAIERATVVDNDVTISAAEGSAFGNASAGIEIRGRARDNVVRGNRIRGRARRALALETDFTGAPAGTQLDGNDREGLVTTR
jgi:hypothetical protein